MKKVLSVFLSVLFVLGSVSMLVSAGPVTKDADGIYCLDFLDFSADTTALWARYNEETGKWEQNERLDEYGDLLVIDGSNYNQPIDENGNVIAPCFKTYSAYSANTSWSLIENGEVLHFEVTGSNTYPGLSFIVDEYHEKNMQIGAETNKQAEYIKIRVRNYSASTRFTFGFAANATNNYKFVAATISDLYEDANGKQYISGSGEWETYIFSMREINSATNYQDLLVTNPDVNNGQPQSRWGGFMSELLLFPFGYDITDGTGAYPGAAIDIDYIVIGSKEYVTNYKSDLEIKEESITKLELISAPDKREYYVGETIDLTGLQLRATYADGTTEILDSASTSANLGTASESTPVTLKFGSQSVSYNVKVTGIRNIELIEEPESTVYELASLTNGFTPAGYKFKVNYLDGTSNSDLSPSVFNYTGDLTTTGKKTITANYYGQTVSLDIEIINVVDLEIATPDKEFRYNDKLTEENFDIYLVYSDGSKKLSGDTATSTSLTFTVNADTKTPGNVTATVTGVDESLGINVTKEVTVKVEAPVKMEATAPIKTTYSVGEQFDATGMTVSLVYADGKSVAMDADDYKIRFNSTEPGEQTVRIVSDIDGIDLSTTVTVTVDGSIIDTGNSTPSTTNPNNTGDGASTGLIIGIIAAVVVVIAVVVVVIVLGKKKKKS